MKKKKKMKKKKNDQKYFQIFIYQNINWKMLNHILLTCIMQNVRNGVDLFF